MSVRQQVILPLSIEKGCLTTKWHLILFPLRPNNKLILFIILASLNSKVIHPTKILSLRKTQNEINIFIFKLTKIIPRLNKSYHSESVFLFFYPKHENWSRSYRGPFSLTIISLHGGCYGSKGCVLRTVERLKGFSVVSSNATMDAVQRISDRACIHKRVLYTLPSYPYPRSKQ